MNTNCLSGTACLLHLHWIMPKKFDFYGLIKKFWSFEIALVEWKIIYRRSKYENLLETELRGGPVSGFSINPTDGHADVDEP